MIDTVDTELAVWAAQVHENHLALALPFAALALVNGTRARWIYAGLSVVVLLNPVLFYGAGADMPTLVSRRITGIDATVVLAAVNVALWVWHTRVFAQASRPEAAVSMRQSGRG